MIANTERVEEILQAKRSIKGIDMEAFAVAKAAESASFKQPKWLIIKGVQDFADESKSDKNKDRDKYREYSAFVSAQFLRMFLEAHTEHLF